MPGKRTTQAYDDSAPQRAWTFHDNNGRNCFSIQT
jgi:hypothetical protein